MNTKNNRLIAEFMGFKNQTDPKERFFDNWFTQPTTAWGTRLEVLHFDTDWNWLMEVVDKVYSSDIYYDKYIDYNGSMFSSGQIELSANIDHVYKQIVEFIEWYNQNK